jgi:hypothetical protein
MVFPLNNEPVPQPPPPHVPRYDKDGKPTQAQIDYENKLRLWLMRVAIAIP